MLLLALIFGGLAYAVKPEDNDKYFVLKLVLCILLTLVAFGCFLAGRGEVIQYYD